MPHFISMRPTIPEPSRLVRNFLPYKQIKKNLLILQTNCQIHHLINKFQGIHQICCTIQECLIYAISGAQPEIFLGRGGLMGSGHFYKHFVKSIRKKVPQGNIWEFFLLDTIETTFWEKNLLNGKLEDGHNQGIFYKIRALFRFSK